jgi:copper resistance protein B
MKWSNGDTSWKTAIAIVTCALAGAHAQEQEATEHAHHAMHGMQPVPDKAQKDASAEAKPSNDAARESAGHVPPLPPAHPMGEMVGREMTDAMEMDDTASIATIRFDRLERADGDDGVAAAWKFAASVGGDFDKLLLRSEGERSRGEFERSDVEALWSLAVASYWDTQVGVRHDFGRGTDRTWAAFGVQGLAPYWFEVGATAYVGDAGRTALRLEVDYDLSLTQRLVLQPRVEVNAYGKSDPAAHIASGVSDAEAGLRLRYELRRELAPYIGIERSWLFGNSADFARSNGRPATDTRWVVGLRVWL